MALVQRSDHWHRRELELTFVEQRQRLASGGQCVVAPSATSEVSLCQELCCTILVSPSLCLSLVRHSSRFLRIYIMLDFNALLRCSYVHCKIGTFFRHALCCACTISSSSEEILSPAAPQQAPPPSNYFHGYKATVHYPVFYKGLV